MKFFRAFSITKRSAGQTCHAHGNRLGNLHIHEDVNFFRCTRSSDCHSAGLSRLIFFASIGLSIIFGLGPSPLVAQERYDLSACLEYTLGNSPKLKSEKFEQRKDAITLEEQKRSFLPRVDAFVNYQNYFNQLPTYIFPMEEGSILSGMPLISPYPVQLGLPHNLNSGLEINQPLFDMRFFGNEHLYQHFESLQQIKLSIVEEDVLHNVATLYYQIAANKEKESFLNSNLERLVKLQSIVSLQVEQGFAKQIDYEKLLVKTSNLKSKKNKLNSGIRQQTSYLKLMMGMSQEENLEIAYDKSNDRYDEVLAMEKRDGLKEAMLEEQRELASIHAKKINAGYYPKLQAYAAFLFQAQRDRFNFFESNQDWYNIHQWGVKLTVPIMHGFEKRTKRELSEIVDEQLAFGLQQKKEQDMLDYQNAVEALEAARLEQQSQYDNVVLAQKVFAQSELNYEQGTMLLMDFLDAEATLRESKMIYATALLDTKLAELNLLKASGNLAELVKR